jgi:acyl-coenzyme A thioesterase 9
MDYVASTVSYKYVTISLEKKVTIVTAVVDNIKFFNRLFADQDLTIIGYVTYVGRSSIEVQIDVV